MAPSALFSTSGVNLFAEQRETPRDKNGFADFESGTNLETKQAVQAVQAAASSLQDLRVKWLVSLFCLFCSD